MPLYEYHCLKCGKNFEMLQRFSDAPVSTHEECGGAVEKVLSAPAFQLKGTGWYATDYGKGGNKPGALSDHAAAEKKSSDSDSKSGDSEKKSGDSKAAEPKAESKSESKPEAKSESKSESKSDSKHASESKPVAKSD